MPEEIERNRYEFPSVIVSTQPTKIDGKVVMVVTLENGDVWHWDGTNPPYLVETHPLSCPECRSTDFHKHDSYCDDEHEDTGDVEVDCFAYYCNQCGEGFDE